MFSCYKHGWSHTYTPCPLCHPVVISSDNKITVCIIHEWKESQTPDGKITYTCTRCGENK